MRCTPLILLLTCTLAACSDSDPPAARDSATRDSGAQDDTTTPASDGLVDTVEPDGTSDAVQSDTVSADTVSPTVPTLIGIRDFTELVRINRTDATTTKQADLDDTKIYHMSYYATSNTLYALSDFGNGANLVTVDPCTGKVTALGKVTIAGGTVHFAETLAVNPADGVIYMSASLDGGRPSDASSEALIKVDPKTLVATQVGAFSGVASKDIDHFAFANGVLYAIDVNGATFFTDLYTIDLSDAKATRVGPSTPQTQVTSLAFDDQGKMFGTDVKPTPQLVTINLTNNARDAIGAIDGKLRSLAFANLNCP